VRCAVVSADEASEVADALEKAGAALHTPLGETWATRSDLGERATTRVIGVIFVALHPHENDCVDASPP
jgi:hypothetical protein